MVNAQILCLLWNSPHTVCGLLHITPSLQDSCQPYPCEKKKCHKEQKTNIKKLNKLKQTHSENCLTPCLFQTITEKHASSSH